MDVSSNTDGFCISQPNQKAEEFFKKFQNSEVYSDLILICDENNNEDDTFGVFNAHQILLATKSAYIEKAVMRIKETGAVANGKVVLYLDGISKDVLSLVLDFIYAGSGSYAYPKAQ